MNITVISYLFFSVFLLTGCTGKVVKENGCIDISDTTIVNDAESKLIGFYELGATIAMKVVQGDYTSESREIFAVILNPENLRLSYGRDWSLEKWENGQWIRPRRKVNILFLMMRSYFPNRTFFVSVSLLNIIRLLPVNIVYPNRYGMTGKR